MNKKQFIATTILTLAVFLGIGLLFTPANTVIAGGITIPATTGLPDKADTTGQGPVMQVAVDVMSWLLSAFMLLAIIAFVYTGIKYLTSGGDTYAAESAKKSLIYSIIGVAVVGGALVLLNTIDTLLR